jgi:predicted nucleotidyltransferase
MPQLELSHLDLAPQHLAALQALLAQYAPDVDVWAFGSRVNGDAHEGSDLDLVLRNPHDLTQPVAALSDLKMALQESRLPMLIEVHSWSNLPAAFHLNIARCHVVLQSGRQQDIFESKENREMLL